jgi:phosphatidylinositol glycan class S
MAGTTDPLQAFLLSRDAVGLANEAFFDPSMMGLLYFVRLLPLHIPRRASLQRYGSALRRLLAGTEATEAHVQPNEHKFAVYTPLFAPIAVPIVVGLLKELFAYNRRRKARRTPPILQADVHTDGIVAQGQ